MPPASTLTDEQILETFAPYVNINAGQHPRTFAAAFSLDDFVGKTIIEHRQIEHPKHQAPIDVVIFSDGTMFYAKLKKTPGHSMSPGTAYLDGYYFDGTKVHRSEELFPKY